MLAARQLHHTSLCRPPLPTGSSLCSSSTASSIASSRSSCSCRGRRTHAVACSSGSDSFASSRVVSSSCRSGQRQQRAAVKCRSTSSSSSDGSSSSSSSGGSTSGRDAQEAGASAQPPSKEDLQRELKQAIAAEDYVTAARLKEQLTALEMQDPLTGLKWALEAAIAEERYADAARLRDQIKELEELNKPQPPDNTGSTESDTVTHGVRVKVRSYYVPAQSRPDLGQYFFAYTVTISNEGDKVVMLERRHWLITDGNGKVDHVRGPGVVGQQPILKPKGSFEYSSACPLYTTFGTMEGEYEMVTLNDEGEWVDKIEVKIGRFALRKPDLA